MLLHQSGALFNGQLARNRGEIAFMMWPGNHLCLSSTSPGHAFIGSLHKRLQAEKGSYQPGAEVQAEYSPAIK
jgi:hypothetical protein